VFKEESDHVITFVKEVEINQRFSNADIYEIYKHWCSENNFKAVNSRAFYMSISKYFKDYRQDVVKFRTTKSRGYQPISYEVTFNDN
jgi:phage/plasmid-associated DNA primase